MNVWLSPWRKVVPVWMLRHKPMLIWKTVEEAVGENLGNELLAGEQAVGA